MKYQIGTRFYFKRNVSTRDFPQLIQDFKAGDAVFWYLGYDGGAAQDDTNATQKYHISVTLDPEQPFGARFTCPISLLMNKDKQPLLVKDFTE